jgi:hypothetical protein
MRYVRGVLVKVVWGLLLCPYAQGFSHLQQQSSRVLLSARRVDVRMSQSFEEISSPFGVDTTIEVRTDTPQRYSLCTACSALKKSSSPRQLELTEALVSDV